MPRNDFQYTSNRERERSVLNDPDAAYDEKREQADEEANSPRIDHDGDIEEVRLQQRLWAKWPYWRA